jgi:hypothetical protein
LIEGKYVMTSSGAILFPDTFNHSDFRFVNPTSAGRFTIMRDDKDDISVHVHGDSLTLELRPASDDAVKIKCFFDVVFAARKKAERLGKDATHV